MFCRIMKLPPRDEHANITWVEMLALARRVIHGFEKVERRPWPIEASMIELTKQAGDLARTVMMQEQYYPVDWEWIRRTELVERRLRTSWPISSTA